jgi:putative phosphoesterase
VRIGVLSDSHDHVWNLRAALTALAERADVLVHCGDLCAPFIVPLLAEFPGAVHVVFGNNDADRYRLLANAAKTANVRLHGEYVELELGGRRLAVQHFDAMARPLAESGRFDVVCFGHNHRLEIDRVGETWLVNPGAVLGYQPTGRENVEPTFVMLDPAHDTPVAFALSGGTARPLAG